MDGCDGVGVPVWDGAGGSSRSMVPGRAKLVKCAGHRAGALSIGELGSKGRPDGMVGEWMKGSVSAWSTWLSKRRRGMVGLRDRSRCVASSIADRLWYWLWDRPA